MLIEETIGSLKAHEERLKGQTGTNGDQSLLIEGEWMKREGNVGKLLFTREEWRKRLPKEDKMGHQTYEDVGDEIKVM